MDKNNPLEQALSRLYPEEKVIIIIDGANLYASSKVLGFNIDFKKMIKFFNERCRLIRAMYFTAKEADVVNKSGETEYSPLRPLIDWLDYNGYQVITKPTKQFIDSTGKTRIKGNMDIEIAVAFLKAVKNCDHIILFSGDGDFRKLVEEGQELGVKVSVCSTITTKPPMLADELRRQADCFIDLEWLRPIIYRNPSRRELYKSEEDNLYSIYHNESQQDQDQQINGD